MRHIGQVLPGPGGQVGPLPECDSVEPGTVGASGRSAMDRAVRVRMHGVMSVVRPRPDLVGPAKPRGSTRQGLAPIKR